MASERRRHFVQPISQRRTDMHSARRYCRGLVRKPLLFALAALVAATAVLIHHWQQGSRTLVDQTPPATPETECMAAAVARIAAESRNPDTPPPVVRAAPVPQLGSGTPAEDSYAATPPEGYSFVGFDGEMAKAPLGVLRDSAQVRDGLDWIGAPTAVETLAAQAAAHGRAWSFGWIRLAAGARQGDLAPLLKSAGAVVVGASGGLLRARLPGDETHLAAIARLPGVGGVGAMPAEARLRAFDGLQVPDHEPTPVFVTLMEADSDGRWRRELSARGAVVGRYDPDVRAYEANVTRDVLDALGTADFVLAVEPVGTVEVAHDTAVPVMGADALRLYQGSPGLFSGVGGAPVPIAVMDTGLNINHLDIPSNRSSICGANFVYFDPLVDDDDLWVDAGLHGTHVTGTIAGNGTAQRRYAGMAPLVQHIRFAKVLSHMGFGNDTFILRGMDFLGQATACPEAGWSPDAAKPLIVNMSLSATSRIWEGRTLGERKLDSVVWSQRQLYVVAQSNANIHGFSNYGAAKNSLAVGAVLDSGSLAGFSSHGPTADGRLAPQVVGAGVDVRSAAGDGSREGYQSFSGTSMASPAVAGVAALLMDAVPAHRERPALARARLMASAIRPDAWLEDGGVFPTDNSNGPGQLQMQYGLGKVSARASVLNRDAPDGWMSGSAVVEPEEGEYGWVDIEVPEGASRLDLVLTWDEPPADTIASAVLNDLDLWLDRGGDCRAEPCGERSSTSRVDNVEWIVVRDPAPGTYRAKVAASRVWTEAPRAALAWSVIRGSSTPDIELSVDRNLLALESGHEGELKLSLTADGYVAAGTRLTFDCRSLDGARCNSGSLRISAEREDGVTREVEALVGESVEVGELGADETWEATVAFGNLAEGETGAFRLYFKASAWNANAAAASVLVRAAGAGEADVAEASAPANDRFANAMSIGGVEGSAQVDLVCAVAEPGEPVFTAWDGRPAGSVWYSWTAPSDDWASFSVTPQGEIGLWDQARVDVFRGDRIAGLKSVGSGEWGVQFFPQSGQTYLIRIGHIGRAVPLALNWSAGPRPVNDDLAAAKVLEGSSGSVEGTNAGATLEPDEFFGDLAASVWYRWTAPSDGSWQFESSAADLRVLAFTGEHLSELRLVSGFPSERAVFPARGGDGYWIAVASQGADAAGLTYELTWDNHDRAPGNDDFGGAEVIPGEASSSHRVDIDSAATVEPGEPLGSGIRTKWWTWTAPSDGRTVWRIDELTRETTGPRNRLMVSVFEGETLDDLRLVATNGERMAVEFAFDAVGGQQYWISAGLPRGDLWAFNELFIQANATLVWGAAPENDDAAGAATFAGASGAVSGSNAFATNARGERSFDIGRSTLWYAWEAPASGLFRFAVDGDGGPWVLTVYRDAADGSGLGLVASSRASGADNLSFQVSAGVRYMVVIGLRGGGRGGEFTLRWEPADPSPPRYVRRLADGDRDSRGNPVELRNPGSLALDAGGKAAYLATEVGVQVLERGRPTGQLDHAQLLETDFGFFGQDHLLWNVHRNRLLADHATTGNWQAFGLIGAGPELEYLGQLGGHPGSNAHVVLMDRTGSDLYRIAAWSGALGHFRVEDGAIRKVADHELHQGSTPGTKWATAVMANDGRHIYVATEDLLQGFERDPESGALMRADFAEAIENYNTPAPVLAITDDDAFVFVVEDGDSITAFSLQDRLNPQKLATLERSSGGVNGLRNTCRFADARPESVTIDVFCDGLAFAVRWDSESGELKGTDWAPSPRPDFAAPVGFAVSPDDRHLYVVTRNDGIVTFVRDGVDTAKPTARPSD
ncbi:MAG: S8 family serine peptidase [Gammaproteobacteria bacterium]|nr:S8 family serine peptidase [Gammaproteobacteria bacterium]